MENSAASTASRHTYTLAARRDPAALQTPCVRQRTMWVGLRRQAEVGLKCLFLTNLIAELKDFFEKS
jgi:hypothetical protein